MRTSPPVDPVAEAAKKQAAEAKEKANREKLELQGQALAALNNPNYTFVRNNWYAMGEDEQKETLAPGLAAVTISATSDSKTFPEGRYYYKDDNEKEENKFFIVYKKGAVTVSPPATLDNFPVALEKMVDFLALAGGSHTVRITFPDISDQHLSHEAMRGLIRQTRENIMNSFQLVSKKGLAIEFDENMTKLIGEMSVDDQKLIFEMQKKLRINYSRNQLYFGSDKEILNKQKSKLEEPKLSASPPDDATYNVLSEVAKADLINKKLDELSERLEKADQIVREMEDSLEIYSSYFDAAGNLTAKAQSEFLAADQIETQVKGMNQTWVGNLYDRMRGDQVAELESHQAKINDMIERSGAQHDLRNEVLDAAIAERRRIKDHVTEWKDKLDALPPIDASPDYAGKRDSAREKMEKFQGKSADPAVPGSTAVKGTLEKSKDRINEVRTTNTLAKTASDNVAAARPAPGTP